MFFPNKHSHTLIFGIPITSRMSGNQVKLPLVLTHPSCSQLISLFFFNCECLQKGLDTESSYWGFGVAAILACTQRCKSDICHVTWTDVPWFSSIVVCFCSCRTLWADVSVHISFLQPFLCTYISRDHALGLASLRAARITWCVL